MHRHSNPNAASEQPEYGVWLAMRQRCNNPNHPHYKDYGGRGISISPRWATYAGFIADMGKRPSPKHTLDRIDNDGNYEPGNCRWTTQKVQANNCRRNRPHNRLITWQDETLHMNEWCRRLKIPVSTFHNRIKLGWPIERIMTTPAIGLRR